MKPPDRPRVRVSLLGAIASAVLFGGLVAFSVLHAREGRRFEHLLAEAEPGWTVLAVACQACTYLCAGAIWGRVAAAAGRPLPGLRLVRLAIEKLTVDQLVPVGGLAGNAVVMGAMRRMGLPAPVATEAILIDLLSHYAAFAIITTVTSIVLFVHHAVTHVLAALLLAFSALVAGVPLGIAWLLRHRDFRPGPRLARVRSFTRLLDTLRAVSSERVFGPRLLATAAALQTSIVILDAITLWAVLAAFGVRVAPLTALVALVIATIAGTLSFLPGGVGSFEAGSVAVLALFGVSVSAALAGTLVLRGLTLWLPLVPGVLLARHDLNPRPPRAAPSERPR
jgi:uncharacterized membrane protein YbhN (UPF0104 family)